MDYRYETKSEGRNFHRQRKAFVIINKEIEFIPDGSDMSHFEYCQAKGMSKDEFNKITRGYYKDGKLVFYKDNFIYDKELIDEALLYVDELSEILKIKEFDIYFGHIPKENFALDYYYGRYKDGKISVSNIKKD